MQQAQLPQPLSQPLSQPPPPRTPTLQEIRAELSAIRTLFAEAEATRQRITKHNTALALGGQLALVVLGERSAGQR
jgi:hypothetical protein